MIDDVAGPGVQAQWKFFRANWRVGDVAPGDHARYGVAQFTEFSPSQLMTAKLYMHSRQVGELIASSRVAESGPDMAQPLLRHTTVASPASPLRIRLSTSKPFVVAPAIPAQETQQGGARTSCNNGSKNE